MMSKYVEPSETRPISAVTCPLKGDLISKAKDGRRMEVELSPRWRSARPSEIIGAQRMVIREQAELIDVLKGALAVDGAQTVSDHSDWMRGLTPQERALVGALSFLGIAQEQALALSLLFGLTALANGLGGLLPLLLGGARVLPAAAAESDGETAPS